MKQFYKAFLLPCLLSLGALAPPAARAQSRLLLHTAPGAVNSGWTEVARDEFTGNTLDPTHWQTHPTINDTPNSRYGWGCEWYDSSDTSLVRVQGGMAHLRAVPYGRASPEYDGTRALKYRSGMLCAVPGGPFRTTGYGAYEARLRLPADGENTWPTFWLYSGNTEIDILDGARVDNGWTNPGMSTGVIDWEHRTDDTHAPSCGSTTKVWSGTDRWSSLLSRQFNVYTVVWTPDRVTFFFNGREIQTVPRSHLSTNPDAAEDLMINLQMSAWTTDTREFSLDVDYVRFYRPTNVLTDGNGQKYVDTKTYKSDYENVNHDISQPTPATYQMVTNANTNPPETGLAYRPLDFATTYPKVSAVAGSLALAPADRVFYRDATNRLCLATGTGTAPGSLAWTVTPLPYQAAYEVTGNVLYSPNLGLAVYRGADNCLQGYYQAGGTWQHTWLTGPGNAAVDDGGGAVSIREADGYILYRGQDANGKLVIYYFKVDKSRYTNDVAQATVSAPFFTNTEPNPTATYAVGDVVWEQSTGNVLYRGADNRLQLYWWDGSRFNHSWVDDYWSLSTNLMAAKPNTLVSVPSGIYYVGQDDKIHRFVYDGTINRSRYSTVPAAFDYANPGGSPQAGLVRGSLSATPDGSHLNYLGYDGRLQTLYLDGAGQWQHGWVDDYWSTDEFNSFNNSQGNQLASAVSDNGRTFYCDAFQHLRYFSWELSEHVIDQCTHTGNVQELGTLHRTGTTPAAPAAPAPAAPAEVLDLSVAPNPTAGQLTITLPTALRALSLPYTLTSALGAVVQQGSLTAGHLTLELGSLPSGLYVLTTQAPGHVYHTRVVKD